MPIVCFRAAAAAAASGAVLTACSSSAVTETTGFTAGPLVTTTSAAGSLSVDVRTSPQPPVQGYMQGQLIVTSSTRHQPVDGLTITVVPWMPAMRHGTSVVPTVTPLGEGKYQVDDLLLFMPGEWELILTIDGPVKDTANPAFDVP